MKAYLFLAFFLLQLVSFKPVSAGVLEQVCEDIGDSYAYFPCLSIIGPDPRSKTVKDIRDVALLAADISIDRAVKVQSYAKTLLDSAADDDTKQQAEAAYSSYADKITNVESLKESLNAGKVPKANSVAYVGQHLEDSAGSLDELKQLERDYDNAYFVLTTLIAHM